MQFLIDVSLILIYTFIFFLLCAWAWRFWKMYVNQKYLNSIKWVMLEIKLPREIMKSPLAMEVALASLLQGGGIATWYKRNFVGSLPAYSSLEIASLEGVIHFYVRLEAKFRPLIESNLYAQYPGIEISEVDDYTSRLRYHHFGKDVSMWGANYTLAKSWVPINEETGKPFPNPEKPKDLKAPYSMKADFLPIKTYVDYGLDKDPKEEFKTDPITTLLEFMGSIGKGEDVWYQILVQDEGVYNGSTKMPKFYINEVSHKHFSLKDMVDQRKKQIRKFKEIKKGDIAYDMYGNVIQKTVRGPDDKVDLQPVTYAEDREMQSRESELTIEEKDEIEVINKKISKPLACVVIRLLYLSKKENWNPAHINNILAFPKPFNGINSLAPNVSDPYDFPWQNIGGRRTAWRTEEMFEEFVEREGFFPHIPERSKLDSWEDMFFWNSSMETRKIFRMIYEAIFYPFSHPQAKKVSTINMEELATLWHFPGAVASTPTLPRIDSTKGVAPVNLPQ